MALDDEHIREIIRKLPQQPGVYQYFDVEGEIIYIGKAKNLKKRVLSYLNKTNQIGKTLKLVRKITDIRYIVVETEEDALLLESNLIKKYKPRFNVLLKDDKSFPWICIVKENFPRVFLTRQVLKNGSEYFGPYTSAKFAYTLISLIKSLYKLRTCNLNLQPRFIEAGKYKVCLEYHIGNCYGPCEAKIDENEYNEWIVQIRNILKGNINSVIELVSNNLNRSIEQLQFEKAHDMKIALDALKNYKAKSTIVNPSLNNIDVFSYIDDEKYAYVNYLRIVHGAVTQIHTIELQKKLEEEKEELLSYAIYEIRQLVGSNSKEVLIPFYPDVKLSGITYTIPKIGDKKNLLELSERNAAYFKLDKDRQRNFKREDSTFSILQKMKTELKLPTLPHRIECFDNSNTQGTNPVASCVVFIDGKPAKKEYRKFHVKTVVGPDDFASMEEIVFRRYKRVLDEGKELPDLIVIDGGKGQLHSAVNSLEKLGLNGRIPIVGLAKRMEEVFYPGDKDPYLIAKNSVALKILMQIRDEAHRFGITFHRKLREKPLTKSALNEIKGIGNKTEEQLIRHFKSVENIKQASLAELTSLLGVSKANIVFKHFHSEV